jgi:hypothetical protein
MCERMQSRVFLLDNSGDGSVAPWILGGYDIAFAVRSQHNLGVPKSWNQGVHFARAFKVEYVIIVSQSIRFDTPNGGQDFLEAIDEHGGPLVLCGQYGWKLVAVRLDVFDRVGMFDEIFTPAYYEESDFLYRMHLAGLPSPWYNDRKQAQFVSAEFAVSSAGDALAFKSGLVQLDYGAQVRKYVDKWGGQPREERWVRPYGLDRLDHTFVGDPPRDRSALPFPEIVKDFS